MERACRRGARSVDAAQATGPGVRTMRGFTLVELLIATGLLGAIAAAGLGGLLQASKAARHISAEQTTQERAEYALATLEADIQMAGYFGFGTPTPDTAMPQVPPLTLPCGTELL